MPRSSALLKKKIGKHTYWKSQISGKSYTFGNVSTVSKVEALTAFAAALAEVKENENGARAERPKAKKLGKSNVAKLHDDYLAWVEANQSKKSGENKKSILGAFCRFKAEGSRRSMKHFSVNAVTADHLYEFLDFRRECDLAPKTIWHDITTVKACWNWGAGRNSDRPSAGHMPETHDPFRRVKRPTVDQKNMTADSLLSDEEVSRLFQAVEAHRTDSVYYLPILMTLHLTGARPGELCGALVKDFQSHDNTIVLYRHKNDGRRTGDRAKPRVVPLSPTARKVVAARCEGQSPNAPIFRGALGAAWAPDTLARKFRTYRKRLKIRDHLTTYSFRDLWISKALSAGMPIASVASAAGTSIKMIEKTYGHFYAKDLVKIATTVEETLADFRLETSPGETR